MQWEKVRKGQNNTCALQLPSGLVKHPLHDNIETLLHILKRNCVLYSCCGENI